MTLTIATAALLMSMPMSMWMRTLSATSMRSRSSG
jgi:hypothetical protein